MSLETIVKNMVTAKEPEANIIKVITHYNQINKSPLKQIEEVQSTVVEEVPECEGENMVWSEEQQKCIPKQIKPIIGDTTTPDGKQSASFVQPINLEEVEVGVTAPEDVENNLIAGTTSIVDKDGNVKDVLKLSSPGRGEDVKSSKKFDKWLRKQPKEILQVEIDEKRTELGLPIDNSIEAVRRRKKEFDVQQLDEVVLKAGEQRGTIDGVYPNTPEGRALYKQVQKERALGAQIQQRDKVNRTKVGEFFNDFGERLRGLDMSSYHEEYDTAFGDGGEMEEFRSSLLNPMEDAYVAGILQNNRPVLDQFNTDIAEKYNLAGQRKDIYDKFYENNKSLINSIEEKYLRQAGVPLVFSGGKLQLAADPNSPIMQARMNTAQKNINDAINALVSEELKKDKDYLESVGKYDEETEDFKNNLIKTNLDNNVYYRNSVEAIDESIKEGMESLDKKRVEEKYGEGLTGEILKWWDITLPAVANDTQAGSLKYQSEQLKAERKRIESLPDDKLVTIKRPLSPGQRVGLSGAPSLGSYKVTKEQALKDIDKKLESTDKQLFDKLTRSVEFQKELALFDNPEIFDKEGMTWNDAKKIVGEQGLNVISTVLTLGLYTTGIEGTAVMKEILTEKAAANMGISVEKFSKLPAKTQAKAMADVEDADLSTAVTAGLGAGAMDLASTVLGARAILKGMPKGLWRAFIRDGYLSPASQAVAKEQLKRGGSALVETVAWEEGTETGQNIWTKGLTGVALDRDMLSEQTWGPMEEWEELWAQTAFSTATLAGGAKVGGSIALNLRSRYKNNPDAYIKDLNNVEKKYNKDKEALNNDPNISYYRKAVENKKLDEELQLQWDAMEAANNMVNSNAYKNLEDEQSEIVYNLEKLAIPLKREAQKLDTEIEAGNLDELVAKEKKDRLEVIKNELNKIDFTQKVERALDLGKKQQRAVQNSIEFDPDSQHDTAIFTTKDTVEDLAGHIEEVYGSEVLESDGVQELLNGERSGIFLTRPDGTTLESIGWGDQKIREIIHNTGDFSAANYRKHEAMHMGTNSMGFKALNNLRNSTIKQLENSKDPLMQDALNELKQRKKAYQGTYKGKGRNLALANEFMAALSDTMFNLDVNDLSIQDKGILSKIGDLFSSALGKQSTVDFGKLSPENVLDFIKSYQDFKGGKIKVAKGKDTTKKELASKPTLFETIDKLVPQDIKTKADFDTFLRDPRKNRPLFDAIINPEGAIHRYVRENQTSQEQGDKTLENLQDRILGFNPEATRKTDGKPVGIEGFTERVMSDAMFGKLSANRDLFKEGEKRKKQDDIDKPEAKQVLDKSPKEINVDKPALEGLKVSKEVQQDVDKIIPLSVLNAEKAIKRKEEALKKEGKIITQKQKIAARDRGLDEIIKRKAAKPLKTLLKENAKEQDNYISNNWEAIAKSFVKDKNIAKIQDPKTKALLNKWKNGDITKDEVVNYFTGKDLTVGDISSKTGKPLTKGQITRTASTRKTRGLTDAIVSEIRAKAIKDYATKNKKEAARFKKDNQIILASKQATTPIENIKLKALKEYNAITESGRVPLNVQSPEYKKGIIDIIFPAFSKEMILNAGNSSRVWHNTKKNSPYAGNKEEFIKIVNNPKQKWGPEFKGVDFKLARAFQNINVNGFKPFANGKNYAEGLKNGTVKIANDNNLAIHKQLWERVNSSIEGAKNLPKAEKDRVAQVWAQYFKNSNDIVDHPHRLTEVAGYSPDFYFEKGKDKGSAEYEHAKPANEVWKILLNTAIEFHWGKGKIPFDIAYKEQMKQYKVLALSKPQANIVNENYKNRMPVGAKYWWQRYAWAGVDLSKVLMNNGKTMAQQFPASKKPILASKPLSKEFNKMLERSKGVKAEAEYSEARAIKLGEKKGFQAFVPYSAEDYLGLVYPTLGEGKQGDADLQWYKDNIMDPYNNGIQEFEVAKQGAMTAWNQIKKKIKNTPANLKKEAVRGFNNEDAIRIYLWDKEGVPPSNLAKKDITEINKYVNNNPDLLEFAEQIQALNPEGYPAPNNNWLAGTITTDLVNHVNTVSRSEFLKPWQEAVDIVYSDTNKNKLRATFGNNYVEALEDTLYRMKTGRNRPAGTNRITNTWLNWLNDSVGTVMFLNQRSALLQTISSVNYLNWTDNNPAKAAKAFANQKQFWTDFSYLFNSDFLKQRRSGLKTDVNADEIAQSAATSPNKARAAASWLLKKGFLPTQIADSFAISLGGASFYRNRVNRYKKEGLSQKEAEEKAFLDFRNNTTESQQSADPSRISMQQASPLGRVILAFANTPIQYTRLTKRALQDLKNGRGDWKTNVSKIIYYGAVQNIIFTGLQQALFGMLFDDDEPVGEKEAQFKQDRKEGSILKLINSSADTILRGSGVGGAFIAMLKNLALEAKRQSEKSRPDYERVADKLFSFSPVIDSKFRKLQSAGRTFTYKQELKKIQERGVAIDNPALMAAAQTLSAFANIPLDRAIKKINNLKTMTEEETKLWQQIALFMGYGEWELGIQARKVDEERAKVKKEKEEEKKYKNLQKNINKGTKKKSPVKALQHGVLGRANRDGTIEVAPGLSPKKRAQVIRHEKLHQKEMKSGKLDYDDNFIYYGKKKFERKNGKIAHAGKWKPEGDHSLPWEKFAHKHD